MSLRGAWYAWPTDENVENLHSSELLGLIQLKVPETLYLVLDCASQTAHLDALD